MSVPASGPSGERQDAPPPAFDSQADGRASPGEILAERQGLSCERSAYEGVPYASRPERQGPPPEILAPAGDMPAALAALAAGADAVYLGLKHFSARMQAENFSTADLARLADLAHAEQRRVYVAMNTLVKPGEPEKVLRLIARLVRDVGPDALIVQDPAILDMAAQAGFAGELHLSTLANITHPAGLRVARDMGAHRVILPRELSIDEARRMNDACPEGLELEIFVHGALCYCVSGRCWWSSYMGGKSGLRGRCVQPCRRVYTQKGHQGRFFSCLDLSLDVLARNLLPLERIRSWKIEGRKKGPHYVYYVTTAYRLLRDEPDDPAARKEAESILEIALGRPGTRSLFLPQKPQSPTRPAPAPATASARARDDARQTGSGLLCGRVGKGASGRYEFRPRLPLLPKDFLRIGYEDDPWHCTVSIPKWVAEGASFTLSLPRGKHPKAGTPVFLIDRRAPELLNVLKEWEADLKARTLPDMRDDEDGAADRPEEARTGTPHTGAAREAKETGIAGLKPRPPRPLKAGTAPRKLDILLRGSVPQGREGRSGIRPGTVQGLWLSPRVLKSVSPTLYERISWWLPPVIWPDEEAEWQRLVSGVIRGGARHFVLGAPWQIGLFGGEGERRGLQLAAGPFCNIANAPALGLLARLGFSSAVVSPELAEEDLLGLPSQSPLPLGIVLAGFWPCGITRHATEVIKDQEPFRSPKGETFWSRRYGGNTWIYPAWPLDLTARRALLEKAGYVTFVTIDEHPPRGLEIPDRPSEFNWSAGLL